MLNTVSFHTLKIPHAWVPTHIHVYTYVHTHTEIIKRFLSYKKRCKGNNSQTSRILRLCSSPFTKFVHAQSTSGGQRGDIQRLADPAKQAREEEQPIKYVQLASYFFHCKEFFGYLCTYHCFEVFHPRDQSQSLSEPISKTSNYRSVTGETFCNRHYFCTLPFTIDFSSSKTTVQSSICRTVFLIN